MLNSEQYSGLSSDPTASKASPAGVLRVWQYAMAPVSSTPFWYATQFVMAAHKAGHSSASVIKSAEMMAEPKTQPTTCSPVTHPVGVAVGSDEVAVGSEEDAVGSVRDAVGSLVELLIGSVVGSMVSPADPETVIVSNVVVPPAVIQNSGQYLLNYECSKNETYGRS